MCKILAVVLFCSVLFCGCDQLKGSKGEKGDSGTSSVPTIANYTGTPSANPHAVSIPAFTGGANQVVLVYLIFPNNSAAMSLPYASSIMSHYYLLVVNKVVFGTEALSGSANSPEKALYDTSCGGQCSYGVKVLTFPSAQMASEYKSKQRIINSDYGKLIYGD